MAVRNFALIGCGSISDFHAQALAGIPGARLVVVAEPIKARAKKFAEREKCDYVTDYRELLKRPDVQIVCVTTPSGSHAPIGMDVLRAGKNLVLEKPMAMQHQGRRRVDKDCRRKEGHAGGDFTTAI